MWRDLLKSRGEEDEQDVEVDEEEELRLLNCDSDEDLLTDGELENDESEIIDDDLEDFWIFSVLLRVPVNEKPPY